MMKKISSWVWVFALTLFAICFNDIALNASPVLGACRDGFANVIQKESDDCDDDDDDDDE